MVYSIWNNPVVREHRYHIRGSLLRRWIALNTYMSSQTHFGYHLKSSAVVSGHPSRQLLARHLREITVVGSCTSQTVCPGCICESSLQLCTRHLSCGARNTPFSSRRTYVFCPSFWPVSDNAIDIAAVPVTTYKRLSALLHRRAVLTTRIHSCRSCTTTLEILLEMTPSKGTFQSDARS